MSRRRDFIPALRRDYKAVAALEFALIAPLLILMGLGAVEYSAAIRAQMQVDQIAHTVANLIANQTQSVPITAAQLKDYLAAGQAMYNYGGLGTLAVSAASINYTNQDSLGNSQTGVAPVVGWDASNAAGAGYSIFPANANNSPLNEIIIGNVSCTIGQGYTQVTDCVNNDSVVVVVATASFTLPFAPNFFGTLLSKLAFSTIAFARPRYELQIAKGF